VGAQSCWATNTFAQRGPRAIALDIATVELQGLHTADYFLNDGEVYFERVLGSMQAIPLASRSVDYVFFLPGPAPQRPGGPAAHPERDLPRPASRRKAAGRQRDAANAALASKR